ncbi:TadE family protein [Myceligenerans pegani]|uniref:TadE-like protein n=1 Tax=Myceligenerans pegani TaxID=2776917 RepID=A0ABR9N604_9MICO|nr:TadE family protein [Myceligenerans sp. TRM 65318]MBE1878574.1 hypothetical protein [Myceligenerans sp. TRM 65318]MBE3020845.1 hypothetical protein [Myceligenerans sp. TRM 65318]
MTLPTPERKAENGPEPRIRTALVADGGTSALRRGADGGRSGADGGQAAVELVGIVFAVVLVALLAIQGITVAQTASITQEAARNGARALSLGNDWRAVVAEQIPDGLELEDAESDTSGGTARVRVTVSAPLGLGEVAVTDVSLTRSAEFPIDGLPDVTDDAEPAPADGPTGEDG